MNVSEKELARRKFILEGNEWKVIFAISLPVVIYNTLSQIFQFVDTLIAASISTQTVSIVSFVSTISWAMQTLGQGIAVGSGIIIARYFGAGDMEMVRKRISSVFFLTIFISLAMVVIFIPLAKPFLMILRMPQELIADGAVYFIIEVAGIVFLFINTIYFSIEKACGNTKAYMWSNLLFSLLKTIFNLLFVYVLHGGIKALPSATLAAQIIICTIAFSKLLSPRNPFRISLKACSFEKKFITKLSSLSIPIFLERFIFAFGKMIVNSMCSFYGATVIGALGVSNRIGGLSTQPPGGFEEGETTLISQNLGNGNLKRALNIFYKVFFINLVFALFCFVLTGIFQQPLVTMFARDDQEFAAAIAKIYYYERLATILVSINTSLMGLLYGFGKTTIALYLNILRLFVYRIPTLFFFIHYTDFGIEAVGIAMLVSNSLVGISSGAVAIPLIAKIKKQHVKYEKAGGDF